MSYLTQMAGLAVQNFVSAARRDGRARRPSSAASRAARRATLGNFWVDLYRSLVYILLPLVAHPRASSSSRRASPQTFDGARDGDDARGRAADDRARPGRLADRDQAARARTAAASTTRTRPSRSRTRTAFTNFLEMLAILLIPAAQVFMFGRMVGARRQALADLRARCSRCSRSASRSRCPAEQHGSQVLRDSGVNITQGDGQSGGNMADKEVRFGIADTVALGDRDDRTPRTARSTAATTRSPPRAAPSRS